MKRYGGIISIALFIVLTAMFVAAAQQPLKKDTSIDLGKAFSCPVTGKTVAVSLGGNNGDSNALDSGPVIGYPMFEEQDIGGLYGCFSEVCFDDFVIETRDLYKQLLHFNRQILLDHVRPPADPFNPQALDVAAWQSFILEFFKGWIDPNVPVVFIDTHGGAEEMAVAGSWEIYDDKGDSVFGSKEEEQAFRDKAQAFADALVTSLKADDGPFYKEIISKLKDPPSNWKDLIYTGFTDEKIGGLPIVLFGAPIFWALPEKEFVMTQSCTGVGIPTARQVIGFDYCADIGAGNDIFNEILERLMGRRNKGNGRNTLEAVKDLDVFITPKTITFTASPTPRGYVYICIYNPGDGHADHWGINIPFDTFMNKNVLKVKVDSALQQGFTVRWLDDDQDSVIFANGVYTNPGGTLTIEEAQAIPRNKGNEGTHLNGDLNPLNAGWGVDANYLDTSDYDPFEINIICNDIPVTGENKDNGNDKPKIKLDTPTAECRKDADCVGAGMCCNNLKCGPCCGNKRVDPGEECEKNDDCPSYDSNTATCNGFCTKGCMCVYSCGIKPPKNA